MDFAHLQHCLHQLKQTRVLVIGDLILDEYLQGEVKRISREAPVPIVEITSRTFKPGGAANTLYNLVTMGSQALAIGTVGADPSGLSLKNLLQELGVQSEGLVADSEIPTTTKTRISAHSRQSVAQQVLRLDMLPQKPPSPQTLAQIQHNLEVWVPTVDVVLMSDYGRGVVGPEMIGICRQLCLQHDKLWLVDSQENLTQFKGATLLTPNKPEAEQTLGYLIRDEAHLEAAGRELLAMAEAEAILLTRGEEGMSLFRRGGSCLHIPALNRTEVYDVTGAGDTVVSTLAVALASGLTMEEAALLANLAASIVIRRFGASTTSPAEMENVLIEMRNAPQAQAMNDDF